MPLHDTSKIIRTLYAKKKKLGKKRENHREDKKPPMAPPPRRGSGLAAAAALTAGHASGPLFKGPVPSRASRSSHCPQNRPPAPGPAHGARGNQRSPREPSSLSTALALRPHLGAFAGAVPWAWTLLLQLPRPHPPCLARGHVLKAFRGQPAKPSLSRQHGHWASVCPSPESEQGLCLNPAVTQGPGCARTWRLPTEAFCTEGRLFPSGPLRAREPLTELRPCADLPRKLHAQPLLRPPRLHTLAVRAKCPRSCGTEP